MELIIDYYLKKEILNKQEAADMLKISVTTLDRKVKNKGLPKHQKGKDNPYYLASEIMQWMKE